MLTYGQEPIRTLIVDSDGTVSQKLEKLLKNLDHEVAIMSNGLKALDFARLDKPNLIISETRLKDLDGFSLCRILKSDERYKNIKIILTTHHSCRENKSLAEQAKADEIIFKPFNNKELLADIENITGRCKLDVDNS
jgi:DNA-binding response OmpR family regulator